MVAEMLSIVLTEITLTTGMLKLVEGSAWAATTYASSTNFAKEKTGLLLFVWIELLTPL